MNFDIKIKSMNKEIKRLCIKIQNTLEKLNQNQRYIIGVSGIPGSGKTTFVNLLVNEFNKRYNHKYENDVIIGISMDGFHLPKSTLNTFNNKKEAYLRRGVYWTFDPYRIINLLNSLKNSLNFKNTVKAPSFDHKIGDPINDSINIEPYHKIIIMEGIYLHLTNPEPWNEISLLFDEKWFIPIDINEARNRVSERHFLCGIVKSIEEGINRFNNNDLLNANFILENRDKNSEYIYLN
jgi:pantothenate kinase